MILTTYSSFNAVANEYISSRQDWAESTIKHARQILCSTVLPKIGLLAISDIAYSDINDVLDNIEYCDKKYYTFCLMNQIYRFALELRIIVNNPCEGIHVPFRQRNPFRELSDDQINALFNAFTSIPFPEIYYFAMVSGLPFNECAALDRSNIDIETGVCNIYWQWRQKNGSKYRSERVISPRKRRIVLPLPCVRYLQNYIYRSNNDLLFPSKKNSLLTKNDIQECLLIIHHRTNMTGFTNDRMRENFIFRCLQSEIDMATLEEYYGYRPGFFLTSEKMVSAQ